jgi:hypothetical protein
MQKLSCKGEEGVKIHISRAQKSKSQYKPVEKKKKYSDWTCNFDSKT